MRRLAITTCLVLVGSCHTPTISTRRVDREVDRILSRSTQDVRQRRLDTLQQPEAPEGPQPFLAMPDASEIRTLTLGDALQTAVRTNRDYQTELENLYLTAVQLLGQRNAFSPQVTMALAYTLADATGTRPTGFGGANFAVTQLLPWGGDVRFDLGSGYAEASPGADTFDTSGFVRLTQPLLRGAGYVVSHEPLIQAERSMIYAIRSFERFRESFAIDVASRFYDLVRAKQQIDNQADNLANATFDREKAEALAALDRVSRVQVLRARRQELNSQNALLAAQESYALAVDLFRIFLGLPESVGLEIVQEPPVFVPVAVDQESATAVALENRLDLLNQREQVEDAARAVRNAANGLLPDLDLVLQAGTSSLPAASISDLRVDQDDLSAGLTLGIPIDRIDERYAYRSSEILLTRARRNLELFEENLRAQVRSSIRELQRRERSLEITRQVIESEAKNKRIAELQFERGEIDNRELVDAEQSLLNARNTLIAERVDYELARLGLLRQLGILFIDESGLWNE